MAEKVGFEPTDRVTAINALAGRPIRPLWHFSACESRAGSAERTLFGRWTITARSLTWLTERWQSGRMHPP